MIDERLVRNFHRDGFLVVEAFFEGLLMDRLQELAEKHFGRDPDYCHDKEFLKKSKADVIPWFPQNEESTAFDTIDRDTRLQELTDDILGGGWKDLYCMVMFSKPMSEGQAWHQDCPPDNDASFNLNRLVYTNDITGETGGEVVVVPGSHKRGLLPAGDPVGDIEGQVALRPEKGTLLLLHGHTWHRVLPVKGAPRVSTNYRAVTSATPGDVTDVCVYRNMRYRFSTAEIIEERNSP